MEDARQYCRVNVSREATHEVNHRHQYKVSDSYGVETMFVTCPYCCKERKRTPKEKRYLVGDLNRDNYLIASTVLYKIQCCDVFYVRVDTPEDKASGKIKSYLRDVELWNRAQKTKPGVATMGVVVSEYTKMIHRDTAQVYQQILRTA